MALRIAYDDYTSTFDELLVQDDSVNIHQRNLRALATEMYKVYHDLSHLFSLENYSMKKTFITTLDQTCL